MTKAPISVCMITRHDPHLDKCLASFAEYVKEICIVINDPDDKESLEIANKYGAKVEIFTDCNDGYGRIADFSMARNKSLELASQPWIMWCDSDDVIGGADKLVELVAGAPTDAGFMFPYEYSYTPQGQVSCRHYRERLMPRGTGHFVHPVHETLVPHDGVSIRWFNSEEVVFKHQRQFHAKPTERTRNLRILQDYLAKHGESDARQLYYIGLEYFNSNDIPNSIKYLTKYIDASGWADEKAMACYKLVDIYQALGQYDNGLKVAYKSLETVDWFESYYALCRMYYFQHNWQRCAHYGKIATQQPPTKTLLFVNEADRYDVHTYLNIALNHLGDVAGALESCKAGLAGNPTNQHLLVNKRIYEKHLGITSPVPTLPETYDPKCLDIVFATGAGLEPWTPETVKQTGIGGSETMLIEQAKNLAAMGHKVRVYASPGAPGTFDGVEYRHVSEFHDLACDVLVVSRYAPLLDDSHNVLARLKLLWCHDVFAIGATNERLLKADRILALSNWHRDNLIKVHNLHPDHVITTRNGIDLDKFKPQPLVLGADEMYRDPSHVEKNRYRCINSSSPDRSWPVLLEVWPEIVKHEPKAELHLFYGFDNWEKIAGADMLQQQLISKLKEQVKNTPGVFYHGRVSQEELTTEFKKSGVWVYPTWFEETSCISAMQAIAAGCYVVTSNRAALKETVLPEVQEHNYAKLLDGEWTSPEYKAQFIQSVVDAFKFQDRFYPLLDRKFGLPELAQDWNQMFTTLLDTKKTNPIVPYQPTKHYQKRDRMNSTVKLNIAAGPNVFPYDGWINFDKYDFNSYFQYISNPTVPLTGMPEHQQKLATFLRDGGDFKFEKHDMVKPFTQVQDNSADFIYVGQAIEHLNPIYQTPAFLKECHRMLKPGGILRMTTPDLDILIRAYNGWAVNIPTMDKFAADQPDFYKTADPASQLAFLMFGACGPDCTQENYQGHFFLFNEKSMTRFLTEAGFREIEFTWSKCGKNKQIALEIQDEGVSHSLIVEAIK